MITRTTGQCHLNQFEPVDSSGDLLTCTRDSILRLDDETADFKEPLSNFETKAHVACLINANLIPARNLNHIRRDSNLPGITDTASIARLPEGVERRADANLLLNQNRELLIPDSYFLKNLINPAVNYLGKGQWKLPDIKPAQTISGLCFYLEFLDAHFGHVIQTDFSASKIRRVGDSQKQIIGRARPPERSEAPLTGSD